MNNRSANITTTHSSGLVTRLGVMTAIMIVMGSIIGSGVFKKSSVMAAEVQSPGLLLACWAIAGVVTLLGTLTNAEIAGLIAEPGGQYQYLKDMYGRAISFFYGWSCFTVIQTASISSLAYVFSESANTFFLFPRFSESIESLSIFGVFYPFDNFGVKAFAIATIASLTIANFFGVVFGGIISNVFTVLKLLGIAAVVVLGFAMSGGTVDHYWPLLESPSAEYHSSLGLFGAMFAAFLGAFWAYEGWINITFLGGEIRDPKRNIPIALIAGVIGVIAVYLITNLAYLYAMPVDEMQRLAETPNTILAVEVMRTFMGDHGAEFIAVLILVSTFGATNCTLMPASRIYFAMARHGLFFRPAAAVHATYRTPAVSLLLQGAWASMLVLSGTFDQLTDMVVFAQFIFYGLGAAGVFIFRRTMRDHERSYKVHGYPFVPIVYIIFCFVLVVVTCIQSPREAGIGLGLLLAGAPFYWMWRKREGAEVSE